MKCPACNATNNYRMERRLNGNTTCLICGTIRPTSEWKPKRVTTKELKAECEILRLEIETLKAEVAKLKKQRGKK